MLINLLSNAVNFTEEGNVILRVRNKEQTTDAKGSCLTSTLQFEVEDSGPGIAREEFDSVFDAFVQTDSAQHSRGVPDWACLSPRICEYTGW